MSDTEGRNSATSVSERTGRGEKGKKRRRRRGAGREGGREGGQEPHRGGGRGDRSCVLGRRGWQVSGVAESGVSFTVF